MDLIAYLNDIYIPSRLSLGRLSQEQMQVAVRQMDKQRGVSVRLEDLSERLVVSHLRWLLDRKLSPATVNNRRGYFLTLWRHAYRREYTQINPYKADVPCVQGVKKKPRAWSLEQIDTMLQQAQIARPRMGFGPRHWSALIKLLCYTGLRIRAALELNRSDLHGRILIVPPEIQKDREEMVIRLPGDFANELVALPRPVESRYGRRLHERLIPWPWSFDHLQDKFRDYILLPAGLPNHRQLKFHAFRRTVATVIAAKHGKEAARDALGHSTISMTERYLADPILIDADLPGRVHPMDVMPQLGIG